MSLSELQEYIRITKYTIQDKQTGKRETWNQQIDRVFGMHEQFLGEKAERIRPSLDLAKKAVLSKKVLGSQRGLQFGGDPVLDKNARLYNCAFTFVDRVRVFSEVMWTLLCGCGVGFSVQSHHVAKLPPVRSSLDKQVALYTIPDTIEGWADAIGVLLSSYFDLDGVTLESELEHAQYSGQNVHFVYTQIRPKGAPLSSGAKAPGPDGLALALESIREVLEGARGRQLRPIEVYDILMHASCAVVSGGIRRAATVALFSFDDEEMIQAKTGNWLEENPQRARSNNSAMLLRSEVSYEQFSKLLDSTREYGEPGFAWVESLEYGYNPCLEVAMDPVDHETGLTGFSFCNLTEINGRKCKTEQEFYQACEAASILGTIQATYTDFGYLTETTKKVVERDALLGVGITGMMDVPEILLDPEIQKAGAQIVLDVNERLAALLDINTAARATVLKPSGTSSLLLGTASGIHPHHASRYFRRVQTNTEENTLKYFEIFNPSAVEDSVWDPNGATKVITFLCEVPKGAKLKNQLSAVEMLENVKSTQQNWILSGKRPERDTHSGISHSVSNTVTVKKNEWDEVGDFIYENRHYFSGVSLLPDSGDKDYPQAPLCAVPHPRDIFHKYGAGAFFASGLITDAERYFGDLWKASSELLHRPRNEYSLEQEDWFRRTSAYAVKYFSGDERELTYCMKDVYNLKLWEDLERSYVPVPWDSMVESEDTVNFQEESACAGGACELPEEFLAAIRATASMER